METFICDTVHRIAQKIVTPIEFITETEGEYFDAKSPEEISKEAAQFEQSHPFTGDAIRL